MTSNNREAGIGDDHSMMSNFHETQNVCVDLSVETNGDMGYQNSDDVPYLNFQSSKEIENHNNPEVMSLGVSMNEMNNDNPGRTRRKRKKSKVENGKKSRPSCNCKKSECIKLYCKCFASEMFCSAECGCGEDCFNNLLYEDTVDVAKKKIKSKKPSAFDKKNVREDVTATKTTSSTQRRGCNCKNSKCEKRYCECFQAGVPCTEACHCQGCQNPCGTARPGSGTNGNIISDEMRGLTQVENNNFLSASTILNSHENSAYFNQLPHGNNNNFYNNHTPEDGMFHNYNSHDPFIPPFPYTNRIHVAPPFNNLASNCQQSQDHNDLLYQPSMSTYVRARSTSNLMPDLQGNQQGITQTRLNFSYMNNYCSNGSFAQNGGDNFM